VACSVSKAPAPIPLSLGCSTPSRCAV